MKKFIIMPDSFKGTMSSIEICEIMEKAVKSVIPDSNVRRIPVADGGEGSVDAFLSAIGGKKVIIPVKNPFMQDIESYYALINDGSAAIVEMAACAGLPLAEGRLAPDRTTTYGVGQLIVDAAGRGVKKIIVGLGGSATNDGGCGAAAAAGVRFYDGEGKHFIPTGGTLSEIADIDVSDYNKLLRGVEITAMCDIDNPLYGKEGAAYVFGPQKGADLSLIKVLDAGLKNLGDRIRESLGADIAEMPGAGAAGGMGAGMSAFFNADLKMGIDVVLDAVNFDELIAGADMIFTGEGRIDGQSLRGKVVVGVARRAKASSIPVVAIVGDISEGIERVYDEGVAGIFSINKLAVPFSQARLTAREDLFFTVQNLMRYSAKIS